MTATNAQWRKRVAGDDHTTQMGWNCIGVAEGNKMSDRFAPVSMICRVFAIEILEIDTLLS